ILLSSQEGNMPEQVMDWAKAVAVFGGVLVGIFAVYASSWVWLRQQRFGRGSAVLCLFGTILIVAPIFRDINLLSEAKEISSQLPNLQLRVEESIGTNKVLQMQLQGLQEGSLAVIERLNMLNEFQVAQLIATMSPMTTEVTRGTISRLCQGVSREIAD